MMPKSPEARLKMCVGKIKYTSKETALFMKHRMYLNGQRDTNRLQAYQCPVCHFFHLGNNQRLPA